MKLNQYSKQRGAVLLVGLIMLLVLTVVGTSSMTSVTLEERMASNMYDSNMAFQGAEAGLRDCERTLVIGTQPEQVESRIGQLTPGAGYNHWWEDLALWNASGVAYGVLSGAPSLVAQGFPEDPRCLREFVALASESKNVEDKTKRIGWNVFRVTATSVGADTKTRSTVQSVYMARNK